jgi:hypothetical protein
MASNAPPDLIGIVVNVSGPDPDESTSMSTPSPAFHAVSASIPFLQQPGDRIVNTARQPTGTIESAAICLGFHGRERRIDSSSA